MRGHRELCVNVSRKRTAAEEAHLHRLQAAVLMHKQRQSERGGEGTAIERRHLKPSSHYKSFSVVRSRLFCVVLHDWAAMGGSHTTRFWPRGEVTQEMI